MNRIFHLWICMLLICSPVFAVAENVVDETLVQNKKNVIVIGASGSLAKYAIDILAKDQGINLTLFLRDKSRLRNDNIGTAKIIEGDVFDYNILKESIKGQDVVYANLSGDLGKMAQNIVKAMNENTVSKLIFICSIGIYKEPVAPVLVPYRKAADVIEASNLDYTILRPSWFTDVNEVDYEITKKGEPEKGSVVSRKSIATFIVEVIKNPEKYKRQNLGINKPNS